MRRLIVAALAAAVILVTPAVALAKGPSEASISGPGLTAPLRVGGGGDIVEQGQFGDLSDAAGPGRLGCLMQHAGFSEGVWGPQAGLAATDQPEGELGPRYTVTWTLPGPTGSDDLVRQDLYPFADAGPFTYIAPGQPFFDGQRTVGGWFAGGPELSALVLDLGLRAPAPPAPAGPGPLALVALGGATVAAGCMAVWAAARGRRRPTGLPGADRTRAIAGG